MSDSRPPNPFYERHYQTSTNQGHAKVSISAPGGLLPVGEDANELIAFLQLIIRQIERSRDKHEAQTRPVIEQAEST